MDAFENLESVLADSVSKLQTASIMEDVEKLKKACLWLQHCMEQRDAVGAYQWRGQIATLAQSLHSQLKAGGFPSDVEASVQQAFADLKPLLVSYKAFSEQMQAIQAQALAHSQALAQLQALAQTQGYVPPHVLPQAQAIVQPQVLGQAQVLAQGQAIAQLQAQNSPQVAVPRSPPRSPLVPSSAPPAAAATSAPLAIVVSATPSADASSSISSSDSSSSSSSKELMRTTSKGKSAHKSVGTMSGKVKRRPLLHMDDVGESTQALLSPRVAKKDDDPKGSVSPSSSSQKSDLQIVYRAKYRHIAPIAEWLDFNEGDVITQLPLEEGVDEMLGWDRGRNATTGQVGMFPLAYTAILASNSRRSDRSLPRKMQTDIALLPPSKASSGSRIAASPLAQSDVSSDATQILPPPAIVSLTPEELEKEKALSKRTKSRKNMAEHRMDVSKTDGKSEEEPAEEESTMSKRQRMGIAVDRRASMLIGRDVVLSLMEKEKTSAIPKCLLFDDPRTPVTTVTNKNPSNSKERKQQKEEIEEIIEKIAKSDPKVRKVDLSEIKIPYSILKKLFAAVARNSPALYSLNLANVGFTGAHVQLFELSIQKNMNLRELDLRNNDLGVKEAKLLETIVQRCYGLVKLYVFTDEELKKKELISTMQNIDWYLQSNVAFLEFIAKRQTALRLCGRAIHNCNGWESYVETTLLNASHNYIKEINPKIGTMKLLTEINFSHNDISNIPYSFGQLESLTHLDVSHNQIKEVPSSLDRTKLTILNVENNKIRYFPKGVMSLPTLKEVHALQNKVKLPKDTDAASAVSLILAKHCK